jgi:anti-anti-sigma factor
VRYADTTERSRDGRELRAGALAATVTMEDDELRFSLDGELDVGTSRLVGALGAVAPLDGRTRITIDLTGLTFIDLRGVRTILRIVARCAAAGGRPRLIPPGRRCPAIITDILSELATTRGARVTLPHAGPRPA